MKKSAINFEQDEKAILELAKGMRDFYPEEKILRDEIVEKLKKVFEKFGFVPIETPVVEKWSILASKYAGGAEILKETFKLTDQGGRQLGLRYDLTVPFARFVGMNPTLKIPFKRYQIERVYRDGPIKAGRYREFYQCDVDIVGSKEMLADFQCIEVAQDVFKQLGLDVNIEINNRKILNKIMENANISDNKIIDAILIIDKLKKIGESEVEKELRNLGLKQEQIDKLFSLLTIKGKNKEKINILKKQLGEFDGINEIEELFSYIEYAGFSNCIFEPSLARGLSYYTATIFEGYLKNGEITSSLCGGGRYDKMISQYLQSKQEYPAVGISFGLEPIFEVLKNKKEIKKTKTQVFIIPIKTYNESLKVARELRDNDVNVDIDISKKGISKNLEYANYYGIPYVIFVGEEELKQNKLKLRDMKTGKEEMLSIKDIIKKLK